VTPPLLNAKEAAKGLGWSRSTFDRYLKLGRLRNLIAMDAPGQRRFIPEAIGRFNRGESNTRLIHRRVS
jgi:predicted site-specific integrase-resolvase